MKVKICGIKTIEDAKAAYDAGADFLGFNFVPISKRYIKPETAEEIISHLRYKNIRFVGVFQNEKLDKVNKLINFLGLDYVQLHRDESMEYVNQIENTKVIRTITLPTDFDVKEIINKMKKYKVDYFLLDRKVQGVGESLNPDKVRQLTSNFPIILAGGLTTENVASYVRLTKPQIVDVAGGIETDGAKDLNKIKKFIINSKKYE